MNGEKPNWMDNNYKENKQNIMIIKQYIPKNILPSSTIEEIFFKPNHKKAKSNGYTGKQFKYNSTVEKVEIREKIIAKMQDGDKVLLLESPELAALKEIEKQDKKPSLVVIPNNLEFKEVAKALGHYNTHLNIKLINTSALQYLADSEEEFGFIWLDYCGAFTSYVRDLDVLFQKPLKSTTLNLTYNVFDLLKANDSYYFARAIGYVLKKLSGKSKVELLEDVTYRYKSLMYNVGFQITNHIHTCKKCIATAEGLASQKQQDDEMVFEDKVTA